MKIKREDVILGIVIVIAIVELAVAACMGAFKPYKPIDHCYSEHHEAPPIIINQNIAIAEPTATVEPTIEPTIEPTVEPTETPTPQATEEPEQEWLTFLATAYSNSAEDNWPFQAHDCLYGIDLIDGVHIAANLKQLPYGTRVYIEGLGERTVVDTASDASVAKMHKMAEERGCEGWIDIYVGNRCDDMDDWGIRPVKLTIIELGEGK